MSNLLVSSKEIKEALMTVESLDSSQREMLLKRFQQELDFGGITEEEFDRLLKDLYLNKLAYKLSDTDYEGLKKLKERLKENKK